MHLTPPTSISSDRIRFEMSASRDALIAAEEDISANIDQRAVGVEEGRRCFTNSDVLDLFSNPRTSPAMSKYYRTIRLWHIAVLTAAVFSALLYGHFSVAKAWRAFRTPNSWGTMGLFLIITIFGTKIKLRNPGTTSALPDPGQWLRQKGWVLAVEPSDETKAFIAARKQYGTVPPTTISDATILTGTSTGCSEAAGLHAEPEPEVLTAAQRQMLQIEPPQFSIIMQTLLILMTLPLVLEVYTIATTDVGSDEPIEMALWRAGTAAASATVAVLICINIVVIRRSKVGIQALLDQELLLKHQASA